MLIPGNRLNHRQRQIVFGAFMYRHTVENPHRWRNGATIPPVPDQEWLGRYAFHFVKDGSRLSGNHNCCEPWFGYETDNNKEST